MPPKLRALTHRTKLSWHSAPRRSCTVDRRESEEFFRRQLEEFRQYVREHYIAEFGAGHKVLAKGKHSRQFQQTSLRSLLSLEVIPDQIKIPCQSIPHACAYCTTHRYPRNLWFSLFVHIPAEQRRRGRPSRNQGNPGPPSFSSDDFSVDPEAYDACYDSDYSRHYR